MYRRLTSHHNLVLLDHWRNLLESEGIPCELRNRLLGSAAGELPVNDCEPQLWVAEHNLVRARQLLAHIEAAPAQPDWQCACGERLEGSFSECWSCGASAPMRDDAGPREQDDDTEFVA
ncbi:DUF2007 domain-containing protein [Cobetia sp. 5-25-4-2]|jgi:hypothetical protein|uniref:putative signal transducing protein n=1 Tax=Cobetia sp. 5-25-4-2 TaxID=2737459 RepID=UPI0015967C0D|nr:DUF2007 domain-containing protein [Cobetia sp. 5-25-4-2]